ncbi:MAG TPA: hypothetical protein VG755_19690 [Nannocystaceae bacterium]|nr:hypothetical protein [Nannocystaceae bacterium]
MAARFIAIAVLMFVGCGESIYACDGDASCKDGERSGRCEPNGACSFPDPACPSGYRYGEHAADGRAGECVPLDPIAGTEATTSSSTTASTTSTTVDLTSDGGNDESTQTTIDATTTSDGESTTGTTAPITDTASESSSSAEENTGPSPGDPYGSCMDDECIPGSECMPLGALPQTCAPSCNDDTDCPPPTSGEASPTCIGQGQNKGCALECSGDGECPDGMECSSWQPRWGDLCTWF